MLDVECISCAARLRPGAVSQSLGWMSDASASRGAKEHPTLNIAPPACAPAPSAAQHPTSTGPRQSWRRSRMKTMDWLTLLSADRLGRERKERALDPARSEFRRDSDRITFSSAFRRLQDKTQVFPL